MINFEIRCKREMLRRIDMKPRIFISSTFYDLKYVREDLSNFIKTHDFEPIMFEDGDIGYTPGTPLDASCYETMRSADMVLLIIGGNYGSPAAGETKDSFKEYVSITRREFKTAKDAGVPIYIFIDNKVHIEYEIYEANYEEIESQKIEINFKNVKNINVFRFIREIKNIGNLPIIEFDKTIQIKDFLSKQWSDMFKKYLAILKDNKNAENIESTVEDMNVLVRKMNLMLESMGKKILTENNSDEYDKVVLSQRIVQMCNEISARFRIQYDEARDGTKKQFIEKLLDVLKEAFDNHIFEKLDSRNPDKIRDGINFFAEKGVYFNALREGFEEYAEEFNSLYSEQKKAMIQELSKEVYTKQLFR